MAASLRKQDGVLELDIEALKSLFLPVDFLFELSWAAGHYRGSKLNGKQMEYFTDWRGAAGEWTSAGLYKTFKLTQTQKSEFALENKTV